MSKRLIVVFRIVAYLVVIIFFTKEIDSFEFENFISDIIYGAHTAEFRDKAVIVIFEILYYGILSFYIIQTLAYIMCGDALDGKNTSIFRFIKLAIIGLRDAINDPWSSSSSDSGYSNIENILKYRDNKMAFMSNKEAAEYMKGTGHIDMMISRPDLKQSRKTLSYLNNKMSFMSNESALNFLKGK